MRAIQYSEGVVVEPMGRDVLDTPHARGMMVEVRPTFDFNIRIFGDIIVPAG
jgi:hypothetical protein